MNRFLPCLLLVPFLLGSEGGCGGQRDQEKDVVDRQQATYLTAQPIPTFDYSLERARITQLYEARMNAAQTWSVWRSQTGVVEGDCPSSGYPLPYGVQLTSPEVAGYHFERDVGVLCHGRGHHPGLRRDPRHCLCLPRGRGLRDEPGHSRHRRHSDSDAQEVTRFRCFGFVRSPRTMHSSPTALYTLALARIIAPDIRWTVADADGAILLSSDDGTITLRRGALGMTKTWDTPAMGKWAKKIAKHFDGAHYGLDEAARRWRST